MDRARSLAFLLRVSVLGLACRGSLATPRTGTPPSGARVYVDVPYPPPAAQVEVIPALPRDGAVWLDGQWTWQGKRWIWDAGGWVMPPANAYFAPWLTYRQADGRLLFTGGSWHADDGRPISRPAFLAMAMSAPSTAPGSSGVSPTPLPPFATSDAGSVSSAPSSDAASAPSAALSDAASTSLNRVR